MNSSVAENKDIPALDIKPGQMLASIFSIKDILVYYEGGASRVGIRAFPDLTDGTVFSKQIE